MAYTIGKANENEDYAQRVSEMMKAVEAHKQANKPYRNPFEPEPTTLREILAPGRLAALPTLDELNDPLSVFNCTTEHAVSIWTARFGTAWVSELETNAALREAHSFWKKLAQRLYKEGVLDSADYEHKDHTLTAWKVKVPEDGNS